MANKIAIELIEMPQNDSQCTIWGEWAIVFMDEIGNCRGVPWTNISIKPFTMENGMAVAIIDGFTHAAPALYGGIDDNNKAMFCTYKRVV